MQDADLFLRFSLASAVAVGVGVCGIGLLVFAPRGWLGRAAVAAVGLTGMSGVAWLLTPEYLGLLAGSGAAVGTLAVLLSMASVRRFIGLCLKPFAQRRVAGAAVLLAAGGVWGYEAWQFERCTQHRMDETLAAMYSPPVNTAPADTTTATDRGTPIPLLAPTDPLPAGELTKMESTTEAVTSHTGLFIRREPPKDDSNCHGWVFTGGRFHVGGRHVPTILTENGYSTVTQPAAGDLCIYHDPTGEVSHSGLVRAVLSDGSVLVESKWGRMGVYLHEADESAYGLKYTFHRSPRGGHLLQGLDPDSAASSQP